MSLFSGIGHLFGSLAHLLNSLFSVADDSITHFAELITTIEDAVNSAKQQISSLQDLSFDPRFRTRVISVPAAQQSIQDLVDTIRVDLVDKFDRIRQDIVQLRTAFEGTGGRVTGDSATVATGELTTKLAEVSIATSTLINLIRELLDFSQTVVNIKTRIQNLDDLFLPQSNPRKVEKLVEGGSIKIRLGNLH